MVVWNALNFDLTKTPVTRVRVETEHGNYLGAVMHDTAQVVSNIHWNFGIPGHLEVMQTVPADLIRVKSHMLITVGAGVLMNQA